MTAMHGHSRSYNVQAVLVNFILGAFVLARENNFDICLYSKQKRLGRAIIWKTNILYTGQMDGADNNVDCNSHKFGTQNKRQIEK